MSSSARNVNLVDGQAAKPVLVPATLIRDIPSSRLVYIETLWKPARQQLMLEHGHWDWRNKI